MKKKNLSSNTTLLANLNWNYMITRTFNGDIGCLVVATYDVALKMVVKIY